MTRAIKASINTQSKVMFASREIGRLADTKEYILNTALYYSLGIVSGRYVDTENTPTYIEDTIDVVEDVYVSPAKPDELPQFMTTNYNAREHKYAVVNYSAQEDPDQKKNLPRFGRERFLTEGNEFVSYILYRGEDFDGFSESLPQYIRLGKKRGKAKVSLKEIDIEKGTGNFTLNHPIGVYDYEKKPLADLISVNMRPTPLIVQAMYNGSYIKLRLEDGEDIYFPDGLRFLKTKR